MGGMVKMISAIRNNFKQSDTFLRVCICVVLLATGLLWIVQASVAVFFGELLHPVIGILYYAIGSALMVWGSRRMYYEEYRDPEEALFLASVLAVGWPVVTVCFVLMVVVGVPSMFVLVWFTSLFIRR